MKSSAHGSYHSLVIHVEKRDGIREDVKSQV